MITSSYPRFPGDGAGSFIESLARSLDALGHSIHVVAPYDPYVAEMREEIDRAEVCVHRFRYAPSKALHLAGHGRALQADRRMKWVVPLLMPGFVMAAVTYALKLHWRERFDLVHGHWAVPGGAIAGLVAGITSLPLVISLHGSDVYVIERNPLYAAAARYGFRRASQVTACSEDLRDRAVTLGLDAARTTIIPYGVDVARYARHSHPDGRTKMRARLGVPDQALVIGALGRLVHKKGFSTLIEAMPVVLDAFADVYCVIGGQGDLHSELVAQVQRLNITDRVLLPGHIDWQDTPAYYAMCDLVAVPSVVDAQGNVDGLPNVLLEALASGCAVVASRVAGIPSAVEDRVSGVLVPPSDAKALASALLRVLSDPGERSELGAKAHERMVRSFDLTTIAERMSSVYQVAVGEHSRLGRPNRRGDQT